MFLNHIVILMNIYQYEQNLCYYTIPRNGKKWKWKKTSLSSSQRDLLEEEKLVITAKRLKLKITSN